jgi:hypothetical protein
MDFCPVRIMNQVLPDATGMLWQSAFPRYPTISRKISWLEFIYEPRLSRGFRFTHPYNECSLYPVAQLIAGGVVLRVVRLNALLKVCRSRHNMNILSFLSPASTRSLCSRWKQRCCIYFTLSIPCSSFIVQVRNFVALRGEVFSILHGGSYLMLSFYFKPNVACHRVPVLVGVILIVPYVIKLFQGAGNTTRLVVCTLARVGE